MSTFVRLAVAAIAVAVVAAIVATRPGPPVGTGPTPSPIPTAPASPSTYTSKLYAYSITVPPGWRSLSAASRWDGSGAPDMEDLVIDTFVSPGQAAMLAAAAPTSKDLATYTATASLPTSRSTAARARLQGTRTRWNPSRSAVSRRSWCR